MKIVYVTGNLLIYRILCKKMSTKGWKVFGVDKCTYVSNLDLLKEFEKYPNFRFEKIDIKDMKHLYDCDYFINTAAESHVGNSIVDSQSFIDSNIVGVKNLLDLIRHKPINCMKRPLFFTSVLMKYMVILIMDTMQKRTYFIPVILILLLKLLLIC